MFGFLSNVSGYWIINITFQGPNPMFNSIKGSFGAKTDKSYKKILYEKFIPLRVKIEFDHVRGSIATLGARKLS